MFNMLQNHEVTCQFAMLHPLATKSCSRGMSTRTPIPMPPGCKLDTPAFFHDNYVEVVCSNQSHWKTQGLIRYYKYLNINNFRSLIWMKACERQNFGDFPLRTQSVHIPFVQTWQLVNNRKGSPRYFQYIYIHVLCITDSCTVGTHPDVSSGASRVVS